MKRIRTVLFLIVCLALGFGIGKFIVYLMDNGSNAESFDCIKLLTALCYSFAALVFCGIVNTILHEAGHLVFGLLSGYRFLSFRIFSFTLTRQDGKFVCKQYNIQGTMGQCLMIPPAVGQPYFWYNIGGVLVNAIVAIVCGFILYWFDLSLLPFEFCLMGALTAGYLLLMNGIPFYVGGVPNDGMNLLTLYRHPEQRSTFINTLHLVVAQSQGVRLSEMPKEWFESREITPKSSVMEITARNLVYCRLMDEGKYEEARLITEEMMAIGKKMPNLFMLEISCDRLLLELITTNRFEIINELQTKDVCRYLKITEKHMPLKSATLFALEFINNQNAEEAEKHYTLVSEHIEKYSQVGEARTALMIMDDIKNRSERSFISQTT